MHPIGNLNILKTIFKSCTQMKKTNRKWGTNGHLVWPKTNLPSGLKANTTLTEMSPLDGTNSLNNNQQFLLIELTVEVLSKKRKKDCLTKLQALI